MTIIKDLKKLVELMEKYNIEIIKMDERGLGLSYADYFREQGIKVNNR
jgi:hypothetical protein